MKERSNGIINVIKKLNLKRHVMMRSRLLKCFLFTICLYGSFSSFANPRTHRYVATYKKLATKLSKQYKMPVAIILAVAIVESSSGQARVTRHLHNHFGIVGRNSLHGKGKWRSRYKEYKSNEASFRDFCRIISKKEFYQRVKGNEDYKLWAQEISKIGYSEAPVQWQQKVINTITTYNL